MNTTPRTCHATPGDLAILKTILRRVHLDGDEAAALLAEIHGALEGSRWKRLGSFSVGDMADQMAGEVEAFRESAEYLAEAEEDARAAA